MKIPLNSSLLPTIFVSVTVLFTRLVRISAAPSLPGDRSICSEKVKSFSANVGQDDGVLLLLLFFDAQFRPRLCIRAEA